MELVENIKDLKTIENEKIVDKFLEAYMIDDNDWEVLTPQGWIDIHGIGKTRLYKEWKIYTISLTGNIRKIICADEHILGRCDNLDFVNKTYDLTEIMTNTVIVGDYLMTIDGPEKVFYVEETEQESNMYDLQIADGSNRHYYTNGFLTHNSLTLQNLAVNFVNQGYNVAYISLELSEKKCMKRVGSMRLEIPIAKYNEFSKDKEYMKEKIRSVNSQNSDEFFNTKPGKLFIKEYPSGSATISDLDKYLEQVREEAGIDIDCLLVDYIQIMGTEKGVDRNMLYLKGEHLSVGLRAIAQRRNLVSVTATQTDKNKYGVNSLGLGDIPESKAIADTADSVWAIILTPLMKLEGAYHWQHLKLRDCSTDIERIGFKFNKDYLKLYDDFFIQSTL